MTSEPGALPAPLGALLLVGSAAFLWAAAGRFATLLAPVRPAPAERLCRRLLVAALLVLWPAAVLGLTGALGGPREAAAVFSGVALLAALGSRRLPSETPSPAGNGARRLGVPALLTGALVGGDVLAWLPSAPVDWDAMTYHLYFPARWLQEGRIFHVPAVFSDNAAAYAPQNGALFHAWQLALLGGDATVNVAQLLALGLAALALYRLSRRLGAGPEAASLAALVLFWLPPLRRLTYSANVDVFFLAFWLAAVAWIVEDLAQPARRTLVAGGLAAGVALGTKTVGLPLVGLTSLPLAAFLIVRRRPAGLALYAAGLVAGGGWWLLRNVWHTGNPVFPLELSLGPLRLPGAYDAAAVRAGEFHLETAGEVASSALRQLGPAACGLLVLGLVALAAGSRGGRGLSRRLFVLAVAWGVVFFTVVPHNNQARFLLPSLLLALAGLALVFERVSRRHRLAAPGLWLLAAAALARDGAPWEGWQRQLGLLAAGGVAPGRWLLAAGLCAALATLAWRLGRRRQGRRRVLASALGAAAAGALLTTATLDSDLSRPAFLAAADFRGWAAGYLPFARPLAPQRIAYTGANVPYALMGSGFRHRVVYVETRGAPGDGFYEHWRRDPRRHAYHKPALYRGGDDVELWLAGLEREKIEVLVIFRLHRAERRMIASTATGFPVEQAWVRRLPERFEPLLLGDAAEIWRVLPAAGDDREGA